MVYMYCRHDPFHLSLSLFLGGGGGLGPMLTCNLSLCLLVIDVIDFLTIVDINICHNQSESFNWHLTNEIEIT